MIHDNGKINLFLTHSEYCNVHLLAGRIYPVHGLDPDIYLLTILESKTRKLEETGLHKGKLGLNARKSTKV